MDEGALLTLDEAAARSGYRKRELRALVREGRLPAVRAGKRWQIAPADLAGLPSRITTPEPTPLPTVEVAAGTSADPLIALIELLRERDQKLTELLEERSQLTGQVGFLLGQLSEREERIQRLEQAMLSDSAQQSMKALPADPEPVALLDEWTKPPSSAGALSKVEIIADSPDSPTSHLPEAGTEAGSEPMRNGVVRTAEPDPIAVPAAIAAEQPSFAPSKPPQQRRGLFGLFRRRASA